MDWKLGRVGDFVGLEIWLGWIFGRVGYLLGVRFCCVGHLVGLYDGLSGRFVLVGLLCRFSWVGLAIWLDWRFCFVGYLAGLGIGWVAGLVEQVLFGDFVGFG